MLIEYESEVSIDAVVSALRLFRSWFTGYSNIFPFKDLNVFVPLKHKPKHMVSEKLFDRPYELDNNGILEFQRFWKDFGTVLKDCFKDEGKWNELSNALTHFNSSYDRTNDRDKLIDLSISAEALFKKG